MYKLVLFQIAAAGLPNVQGPEAGYRLRRELLAREVGLSINTVQEILTYLEAIGLVMSRGQGRGNPRVRWVNWKKLRAVVEAQRRDFQRFLDLQMDGDEDGSMEVWDPSEYYYDLPDVELWGSAVALDVLTDEPTDVLTGVPIEERSDVQTDERSDIDKPNTTANPATALGPMQDVYTDCQEPHIWEQTCEVCYSLEDRVALRDCLLEGGNVNSAYRQQEERKRSESRQQRQIV